MAESASHHQIQFKLKFQKYLTSTKSLPLLCTLGCWFSTPTTKRWSLCDKSNQLYFDRNSKSPAPTQTHFRLTGIGHGQRRRWFFNPRIEWLLLSAGNEWEIAASHPTSSPEALTITDNYLDIPSESHHQSNILKNVTKLVIFLRSDT